MDIYSQLIFWVPISLTAIVLLWLLYIKLRVKEISVRTANRALILIVLINLVQIGAKIIYIFFNLRSSEFGQYFLPSQGSNYIYQTLWNLCQPYVWATAVALAIILVLMLLRKILHSPIVNQADLIIIFITVFIVGPSSVLVLIIGAFLIMLLFQLTYAITHRQIKSEYRVELSPFLLFTALAILVLSHFTFYLDFLILIKMI